MEFFEREPLKKKSLAESMEDDLLIEKYVTYKKDVLSVGDLSGRWKFLYSIIFGNKEEKTIDEYLKDKDDEETKKEIEDMEKKFDSLLQERGLADSALEALRDSLN